MYIPCRIIQQCSVVAVLLLLCVSVEEQYRTAVGKVTEDNTWYCCNIVMFARMICIYRYGSTAVLYEYLCVSVYETKTKNATSHFTPTYTSIQHTTAVYHISHVARHAFHTQHNTTEHNTCPCVPVYHTDMETKTAGLL